MAVYFTYVWGPPGSPAWPLTFASKAARTIAKANLSESDIVFTVGTKNEPTIAAARGRVLGMYLISDLEVNTVDYSFADTTKPSLENESTQRFPFALHPIEAYEIISNQNIFAEIVGPLTNAHHLKAQSSVVELNEDVAKALLHLERRQVPVALPNTEFGRGLVLKKNSKLAPKHEGSFAGTFAEHEIWFVYTLVLLNNDKKPMAVKVGYGHEPRKRAEAYNCSLAHEITGYYWEVYSQQPLSSEEAARDIEQRVLAHFASNRLQSNGEVLRNTDPMSVAAQVGIEMRNKSVI